MASDQPGVPPHVAGVDVSMARNADLQICNASYFSLRELEWGFFTYGARWLRMPTRAFQLTLRSEIFLLISLSLVLSPSYVAFIFAGAYKFASVQVKKAYSARVTIADKQKLPRKEIGLGLLLLLIGLTFFLLCFLHHRGHTREHIKDGSVSSCQHQPPCLALTSSPRRYEI